MKKYFLYILILSLYGCVSLEINKTIDTSSSKSTKIDISDKNWIIYEAKVFDRNTKQKFEIVEMTTNFDYLVIQNLFSNLSSLSILELLK